MNESSWTARGTNALAALVYATRAFAAGFVFGVLRTFLVAPSAGPTVAVSIEAPLMLAVSWWIWLRTASRFWIPSDRAVRIVVGILALAILQLYEFSLAILVFGRTFGEVLANFDSRAGAIGLAAQFAFAMIPFLQGLWSENRSADPDTDNPAA
jgi:hypothetical protein